jgi:hypothetical protein
MSGPIVLGIFIATIFLLVKYRVPVRDFFNGTPTTAPVATGTAATTSRWYGESFWSILLVVAGMIVFFVGIYNPTTTAWGNPSPASVGSWGQNHWLALLILWGIAAALIALNACGATAKTLQQVATGVVVAMLVVLPLWGWATSPTAPAHAVTGAVQPPQKRMLSIPADKELDIRVPDGYGGAITGNQFVVFCTYENGTKYEGTPTNPCRRGPGLHLLVRDTSGQENPVIYEFVRAQ